MQVRLIPAMQCIASGRRCAPKAAGTSDGVEQSVKKRSRFAMPVMVEVPEASHSGLTTPQFELHIHARAIHRALGGAS